jgi:N-acetylmuramoyl-L-alanine amidase
MIFLVFSLSVNLSGEMHTFKEQKIGKHEYIKSNSMLEEMDLSYYWDLNTQILTIQKENIVSVMPDNPFIKVNRDVFQLEIPPLKEGSELFIPVSSLPLILGSLMNMEAKFNKGILEVGTKVNIHGIDWDVTPSRTILKIECSPTLKHLFNKVKGEWVLVIFDPIYNKKISELSPKGLIEEIKFEKGDGFIKFRFKTKDDLTMDAIRNGKFLNIKVKTFEERSIKTIVIDPGHGGKDPGAVCANVREKDIVLKASKKIAAKLAEEDYNVIMTRTEDVFIPLKDRTEIADSARADLFVSIHCNAAPNKRAMNGTETYFLSAARSDWARTVEATENSAIRYEAKDGSSLSELDYILNDLAQTQFLEESQQAGICIQESMVQKLGLYNRGLKQANFYVLRLNYMPAVLVEIAFITHPEDRKKLLDDKFLEKACDAIVEGIEAYAKSRT